MSFAIQFEGTHIPIKKGFEYKLCENDEIYSTAYKLMIIVNSFRNLEKYSKAKVNSPNFPDLCFCN